jgi:hypothetical protein
MSIPVHADRRIEDGMRLAGMPSWFNRTPGDQP